MKIDLSNVAEGNLATLAIRCPHCGNNGTFIRISDIVAQDYKSGYMAISYYLTLRRCPNQLCNGHLFAILDDQGEVLLTSPSELIPFNRERIPDRVNNAFTEAVNCHSNSCFVASAIMIRKTLEEICLDRGATGSNLFKRLEDLKNKILIPAELLEAMNELRLLGNDAAHLEAKTYDEIGKDEIEISIEFTKEILKAVYQYESLLAKMRSLKSKNSSSAE